jgi:hypothetical protein
MSRTIVRMNDVVQVTFPVLLQFSGQRSQHPEQRPVETFQLTVPFWMIWHSPRVSNTTHIYVAEERVRFRIPFPDHGAVSPGSRIEG